MSDRASIKELEANLSRDSARLQEIERLSDELLQPRPRKAYRDVAEGIRLRTEREMLEGRICRTKILLVDARQSIRR